MMPFLMIFEKNLILNFKIINLMRKIVSLLLDLDSSTLKDTYFSQRFRLNLFSMKTHLEKALHHIPFTLNQGL